MKLKLTHSPELSENEVEIRYTQMDAQTQNLVRRIEQAEKYIYGLDNGRQYRILIDNILYVESVDRKTFVYTELSVYRSKLKLYQFLEQVASVDFLAINKSCILNVNALDYVKALPNRCMEAILINGEKIIISRTYVSAIKAAFAMKGGDKE